VDILLAMKLGIIDYIAKNTSDVIIRGKIKICTYSIQNKKRTAGKKFRQHNN
jgi:hypothetical protein